MWQHIHVVVQISPRNTPACCWECKKTICIKAADSTCLQISPRNTPTCCWECKKTICSKAADFTCLQISPRNTPTCCWECKKTICSKAADSTCLFDGIFNSMSYTTLYLISCVGFSWKICTAYCASLEYILKEVRHCILSSVYKKCFYYLNFLNRIQPFSVHSWQEMGLGVYMFLRSLQDVKG